MVANTVYLPPLVSPSGFCKETVQIPLSKGLTWLDNPIYTSYYVCPGGFQIAPDVFIYLSPSAKAGDTPQPRASCSTVVPNGNYQPVGMEVSHFVVPADWGGRIDVQYGAIISQNGHFIGEYFADQWFFLRGTVDGCPQLPTHY